MISTSATPGASVRRATLGTTSKRLGPAAPGLITSLPLGAMHEGAVGVAEDEDVGVRVAVEQAFRRGAAEFVAVADVDLPSFERQPAMRFEFRGVGVVDVAVARPGPARGRATRSGRRDCRHRRRAESTRRRRGRASLTHCNCPCVSEISPTIVGMGLVLYRAVPMTIPSLANTPSSRRSTAAIWCASPSRRSTVPFATPRWSVGFHGYGESADDQLARLEAIPELAGLDAGQHPGTASVLRRGAGRRGQLDDVAGSRRGDRGQPAVRAQRHHRGDPPDR